MSSRRQRRAQTSDEFNAVAIKVLFERGPLMDSDLRHIVRSFMQKAGKRQHLNAPEVIQRMDGLRKDGVVQSTKSIVTIEKGRTRAAYLYRLTEKGAAEASRPQRAASPAPAYQAL